MSPRWTPACLSTHWYVGDVGYTNKIWNHNDSWHFNSWLNQLYSAEVKTSQHEHMFCFVHAIFVNGLQMKRKQQTMAMVIGHVNHCPQKWLFVKQSLEWAQGNGVVWNFQTTHKIMISKEMVMIYYLIWYLGSMSKALMMSLWCHKKVGTIRNLHKCKILLFQNNFTWY